MTAVYASSGASGARARSSWGKDTPPPDEHTAGDLLSICSTTQFKRLLAGVEQVV